MNETAKQAVGRIGREARERGCPVVEAIPFVPSTVDEIIANATHTYNDDGSVRVVMATCGTCGRTWNDAAISSLTPTPSARCPWESEHDEIDAFLADTDEEDDVA